MRLYSKALHNTRRTLTALIIIAILLMSLVAWFLAPKYNEEEPYKQQRYGAIDTRDVDAHRDFPKVSRSETRPVLPAKHKPIVKVKPKAKPKVKPKVKKKPVVKIKKPRHISMSAIAICIGKYESDNNPTAENPYSTASGYFQFVDGTWNYYKGYRRAKYAPLSVQLEKFYIVWDGGRGSGNWVTAYKCGY